MLNDRTPVTRLILGRLVRLAVVTATAMIAFAAITSKADDNSNAARKPADAARRGDETAAARAGFAAKQERREKSTGIPLPVLFLIMDSVEGQQDLKLTEDQKVKAKYAKLSRRLPREADPREYRTDEYRKKEDEAAKALIDMLSAEQSARLKQIGLQMKGAGALTAPSLVSALGITDEQKKKLQDLESKFRERGAKSAERLRDLSADRSLSPKERQAKTSPLREESRQLPKQWSEAAMTILTPQQREKFENMKGATFGWTFHSVPQSIDRNWMEVLARYPAVQEDLKLTDAQRETLDKAWKSTWLPQGADVLQREKALDEATKVIEGMLSPQQAARLKQIHLQWSFRMSPTRVLVSPEVASVLAITEDQRRRLREVESRQSKEMAALNAERNTPRERQTKWEQLTKKRAEEAMAILSPQQREKFEGMKGAKFDWSSGS